MYTQAAITFLSESNHIFDKKDIRTRRMDGAEKIEMVKKMTSRIEFRSSELVSIFQAQSGWNLARVKFFVFIISALC